MTAKQRKRQAERRREHQARTRSEPGVEYGARPPAPRRRRSLSKKAVRAVGRKLRPDRGW